MNDGARLTGPAEHRLAAKISNILSDGLQLQWRVHSAGAVHRAPDTSKGSSQASGRDCRSFRGPCGKNFQIILNNGVQK